MIKPRKISSLIGHVLEADPKLVSVQYDAVLKQLFVRLRSGLAWANLLEEIDLPVVMKDTTRGWDSGDPRRHWENFLITWDCSGIGHDKPEIGTGFSFGGKSADKQARRRVTEQEEEGAQLIGGRRHVGSGAISGLKSDASSEAWQQEAKQTKAKSFKLTLDVLDKISREARTQDKKPMVFLRFTDIPEHIAVEGDWIILPRSAFEEMDG